VVISGTYLLCLIQLLERYAFYVLNVFLTLYCVTPEAQGGLGWENTRALEFYGICFGSIHLMPLIGGLVSDRILGSKLAVLWGQVCSIFGYLLLATQQDLFFYIGLGLIGIGYGLFKPSVIHLISCFYSKNDPKYDQTFNFFYASATAGVFFATLVGGWMQAYHGFVTLYQVTAVFLCIGLLFYLVAYKKMKFLQEPDQKDNASKELSSSTDTQNTLFLILILTFAVLFYAVHQGGGNLASLYLQQNADRVIYGYEWPVGWILSVAVLLTLSLSIAAGFTWKWLTQKGRHINSIRKMALGFIATAICYSFLLPPSLVTDQNPFLKTNLQWFIGFNIGFSFAKVLVNPTMWSLFNRFAPKKHQALYLGASFICMSLGNWLSGWLCSYLNQMGYAGVFGIMIIMMFICFLILAMIQNPVKRWLVKTGQSLQF
jgi:POT family proton-dependent oligopeptide transporter